MRVFVLDFFVKTQFSGYFDKNDKTILSYPIFLIRKCLFNKKENCSCEIAATHAGFDHVQVGMATKLFVLTFDSTPDWRSVPVVSWTRA